jgi:hypothetical protein
LTVKKDSFVAADFSSRVIAILGIFVLSGCGAGDGYAELGLVEVTGTVTLDDKPLAGANVSFESADKRSATGKTDAAGKYSLMYDSQTRGTTPGPKIVRITTAEVGEGGGAAEGSAAAKESIPPRYNRQSELTADVSASNKIFNFDLKSAP